MPRRPEFQFASSICQTLTMPSKKQTQSDGWLLFQCSSWSMYERGKVWLCFHFFTSFSQKVFHCVCVSSFAERDFFVPYSFRKRYPLLSAVQEKFQELWPQAQHYTITLTGTQCQTSRQSNRFLAVCICDPEHQPPVPFFANLLGIRSNPSEGLRIRCLEKMLSQKCS